MSILRSRGDGLWVQLGRISALRRVAAAIVASTLLISPKVAVGQEKKCPEGTIEVKHEKIGSEIHIYCKCAPGRILVDGMCTLDLRSYPGWTDIPQHLTWPDEIKQEAEGQLRYLNNRQRVLRKLIQDLAWLRKQEQQTATYFREVQRMQHKLAIDSVSDLVAAIPFGQITNALVARGWVAAGEGATMLAQVNLVQASYHAFLAGASADDKQAVNNILSSANDLRSYRNALNRIVMPGPMYSGMNTFLGVGFAVVSFINSQRNGRAPTEPHFHEVGIPEWYEGPDALTKALGFIYPPLGQLRAGVNLVAYNVLHVDSRLKADETALREALTIQQFSILRLEDSIRKKEAEVNALIHVHQQVASPPPSPPANVIVK